MRGWCSRRFARTPARSIASRHLIADPSALEVRYLEVKAKHELLGTLVAFYGASAGTPDEHSRFFGKRRTGREDAKYLTEDRIRDR